MSTTKTGGSAFPVQDSEEYNGQRAQYAEPGMTLLDHFAGQALIGFHAHPSNESLGSASGIACYCYGIAAAMIAERERIMNAE